MSCEGLLKFDVQRWLASPRERYVLDNGLMTPTTGKPAPDPSPPNGLRVLVVDDERALADLVGTYLTRDGFEVSKAHDGRAAVDLARQFDPDVMVLDLGLPVMDGVEVCRQVRSFSDCYIVMLTARTEEIDKLIGLSVGADDYLTKPFSPRELLARIHAMLRRPRASSATGQVPAEEPRLYRFPKSFATAPSFDALPEIGTSIAVDGTNLYVGSAPSTIYWAAKSAAPRVFAPFAGAQAGPVAMVADGGALYWVTDPGGTVATLAADSPGAKPTILASGQQGPTAIAVDASHVYWTNSGDGTVRRVLKTGGEPEVLASGQKSPAGIAVDDTAVVWANVDDGTIMIVDLSR